MSRDTGRRIGNESEIEQLAAGVALQFNNLFASVSLNAELLAQDLGKENERVRSLLRVALRGAELTQQILSFSRRRQLNPIALDLGSLVAGMIDRLTQTFGETIQTDIRQPPELWPVYADPTVLTSAVSNLAGNARDAMPSGGRLVIAMENVKLEPQHADKQPRLVPGDYVALAVCDTGHGIKPHLIERVFEPFFTTRNMSEGVGLGLTLADEFARQSGGHVTIESEFGRGTTVKLYLPRARDEETHPIQKIKS